MAGVPPHSCCYTVCSRLCLCAAANSASASPLSLSLPLGRHGITFNLAITHFSDHRDHCAMHPHTKNTLILMRLCSGGGLSSLYTAQLRGRGAIALCDVITPIMMGLIQFPRWTQLYYVVRTPQNKTKTTEEYNNL